MSASDRHPIFCELKNSQSEVITLPTTWRCPNNFLGCYQNQEWLPRVNFITFMKFYEIFLFILFLGVSKRGFKNAFQIYGEG